MDSSPLNSQTDCFTRAQRMEGLGLATDLAAQWLLRSRVLHCDKNPAVCAKKCCVSSSCTSISLLGPRPSSLISPQRKDSLGLMPESGAEWPLWRNPLHRKKQAAATANKCCVSNMPEHQCRESPATRTLRSEISLHLSRMTAIPSVLQRSPAWVFTLHLRGLRLAHFRFGLEADLRRCRVMAVIGSDRMTCVDGSCIARHF